MIINQQALENKQDEILEILNKDKKLQKALVAILEVDSGNFLVSTRNTDSLETINKGAMVFYNQAFIKDIIASHKLLEDSVNEILNSELSPILNEEPTINGSRVEFVKLGDSDSYSVCPYGFESGIKNISTLSSVYDIDNNSFDVSKAYYTHNNVFRDPINKAIDRLKHLNTLATDYKIFKKKSFYTEISGYGADSEELPLLFEGSASYKQGLRMSVTASESQLRSPYILEYADNIISSVDNSLDLQEYLKITKALEMLTYGEIRESDRYTPSKSSRYSYKNPLFSESGYSYFQDFNKNYAHLLSTIQGLRDHNLTDVKVTIESLERLVDGNSSFDELEESLVLGARRLFVDTNNESLPNISQQDIISYINIGYATFFETSKNLANGVDVVDNNGVSLSVNKSSALFPMSQYFKQLKLKEKSYDFFISLIEEQRQTEERISLNLGDKDLVKSLIVRTRAMVQDVKVDSFFVDFRDGEMKLNDPASKLYETNEQFKKIVDNFSKNKYHDYFEFDKSVLTSDHMNLDYLEKFSEQILTLDHPVGKKIGFKARLLGNYNANGIYMPSHELIALDPRRSSSYIHEMVHSIDLGFQMSKYGRNALVFELSSIFSKKIDSKDTLKPYYLKPEELIARGGEIGYVLMLGKFSELQEKYENKEINKEEFKIALRENVEKHPHAFFIKDYDHYNSASEYLNVDTIIDNEDNRLLKMIDNYFKPFFTNKFSDFDLIPTKKHGNEDRLVEGVSPRNFTSGGLGLVLDGTEFYTLQNSFFTPSQIEMGDIEVDASSITLESLQESLDNCTLENYRVLKELLSHTSEELFYANPIGYSKNEEDLTKELYLSSVNTLLYNKKPAEITAIIRESLGEIDSAKKENVIDFCSNLALSNSYISYYDYGISRNSSYLQIAEDALGDKITKEEITPSLIASEIHTRVFRRSRSRSDSVGEYIDVSALDGLYSQYGSKVNDALVLMMANSSSGKIGSGKNYENTSLLMYGYVFHSDDVEKKRVIDQLKEADTDKILYRLYNIPQHSFQNTYKYGSSEPSYSCLMSKIIVQQEGENYNDLKDFFNNLQELVKKEEREVAHPIGVLSNFLSYNTSFYKKSLELTKDEVHDFINHHALNKPFVDADILTSCTLDGSKVKLFEEIVSEAKKHPDIEIYHFAEKAFAFYYKSFPDPQLLPLLEYLEERSLGNVEQFTEKSRTKELYLEKSKDEPIKEFDHSVMENTLENLQKLGTYTPCDIAIKDALISRECIRTGDVDTILNWDGIKRRSIIPLVEMAKAELRGDEVDADFKEKLLDEISLGQYVFLVEPNNKKFAYELDLPREDNARAIYGVIKENLQKMDSSEIFKHLNATKNATTYVVKLSNIEEDRERTSVYMTNKFFDKRETMYLMHMEGLSIESFKEAKSSNNTNALFLETFESMAVTEQRVAWKLFCASDKNMEIIKDMQEGLPLMSAEQAKQSFMKLREVLAESPFFKDRVFNDVYQLKNIKDSVLEVTSNEKSGVRVQVSDLKNFVFPEHYVNKYNPESFDLASLILRQAPNSESIPDEVGEKLLVASHKLDRYITGYIDTNSKVERNATFPAERESLNEVLSFYKERIEQGLDVANGIKKAIGSEELMIQHRYVEPFLFDERKNLLSEEAKDRIINGDSQPKDGLPNDTDIEHNKEEECAQVRAI